MPRAGLNTREVVAAGADLADEIGFHAITITALAGRLGVKPPSLYKHVHGLADLRHRIAAQAMSDIGAAFRDELQGRSGSDALTALFGVLRDYVERHPGRYAATIGARFDGEDDPLFVASSQVIGSVGAVLAGYGIDPDDTDHAIRAMRCLVHGFATLRAAEGFQWRADPDESYAWMTRFVDAGLRSIGAAPR